ncbi:CrcB family protein [Mumia zhuanghuii]|uniref:Fluoride-specific ion channel FluC n=2 Tax=Mumia TaxID=1546255 RepID=A0ABW1QJF2_9ACTN|nr:MULTISPECIES: CrcB family protein [Mumia]KAA1423705.1 CrcB family protein [Mumia zhuanghuii]
MTAGELVLVGLAGGIGATCRFVVETLVRRRWLGVMPWGTIVVNVSGSLLIGGLAAACADGALGSQAYAVAAVGFCGGYTTFSAAMMDTVRLAQVGATGRAVLNACGTLALTCTAAAFGWAVVAAVL